MNKNLLAAVCASALALASTAHAAPTVTSEVRFGNPVKGSDYREYRLDAVAAAPVFSNLNVGTELAVNQPARQGDVSAKLTGRLEAPLTEVYGFRPVVYGEYGNNFARNNNYDFWGIGGRVSHKIAGPVSATVGVRHRQGFSPRDLSETRYNVGLRYAVDGATSVGVDYYRVNNSRVADVDVVGVSLSRSF